MHSAPIIKDVVLLGGGHAHVLVIRGWAMNPVAGMRLTLISSDVLTPYSGMLPGFVSGHYTSEDIHIDLSRLCRWAGVRFIEATATGVRTDTKHVLIEDRPAIGYDVLSIDTGSTPDVHSVPGADSFTVPVKPIHQFQQHWETFLQRAEDHTKPLHIGVVGSGVGGFEILLAMHHGLSAMHDRCTFHWFIRGSQPIRSQPQRARTLALDACSERGIQVHTGFDVIEVTATEVVAKDGRKIALNEVFWCTAAAAPDWPGESGLETDARGFIATNAYLQSRSHPDIFAAGDVATQIDSPNAKAGVFAVRQAPVLLQNLRRYLLQIPLKRYTPQKSMLSLMALGRQSAIACRGRMTLSSDWVWRWKDSIDRRFMDQFSELRPRRMTVASVDAIPRILREEIESEGSRTFDIRCGGCGAKVSAEVLTRTMAKLTPVSHDDIVVGLDAPDDAAVINPAGHLLVQSVDQFRSMLEDPYSFGRIAAIHALSDIHAMGGRPHSALALVSLPFATEIIQERELHQVMAGAVRELNREDCALLGGHTSEGAEMSIGFSVNGWLQQSDLHLNSGLGDGDCLILTKPIGTGVILAADMQGVADGQTVRHCVQSMLRSGQSAVEVFRQYQVQAMTDITGFGLLGHLGEMLQAADIGCTLYPAKIPLLPGALALSEQGHRSSLFASNRRFLALLVNPDSVTEPLRDILCDPQTSGGLLAGVRADQADDCINAFHQKGIAAAIVGVCRAGFSGVEFSQGTVDP